MRSAAPSTQAVIVAFTPGSPAGVSTASPVNCTRAVAVSRATAKLPLIDSPLTFCSDTVPFRLKVPPTPTPTGVLRVKLAAVATLPTGTPVSWDRRSPPTMSSVPALVMPPTQLVLVAL